ncbi:iron ABC transporter substrate-binding protein [Longibacter salinarum]|uniref:Iron ABC transporter substrate-binding protein n=1 Tax=Longibacter salinarum TaxID=1850348 RepID=A0A2A8CZY0_9BACT|nr:iron ABC transporter substrate-binding protein [Longibacter salinarum]PEN14180.1 iron ABC transporter substrate-binding protein [Longibacter salinarum]
MIRTLATVFSALLLVFSLSACQSGGEEENKELIVYSGRSQALVDSLVEKYRAQSDVNVQIRYGTDSQLLAALQEEGDQSSADVFWANTAGALGNAVNNNLLADLPDTLNAMPDRFASASGKWTPVTARFRVLAYNTDQVDSTALPASITDLPNADEFEGRIGWTPAYSSFQDFVTALRVTKGDSTARAWLESMKELNPKSYTSNTPMIRALAAGEIDIALTNHYYVLRITNPAPEGEYEEEEHEEEEEGEEESIAASAPVATYHFEDGDVGNLALVTGAGVLQTTDQSAAAQDFIRFLLSEEAQAYGAQTVHEYPVINGTEVPSYMMDADRALLLSPDFELERLREIDETLNMLRDADLL